MFLIGKKSTYQIIKHFYTLDCKQSFVREVFDMLMKSKLSVEDKLQISS